MQLRLPHPWYTTYTIKVGAYDDGLRQFQIQPTNPAEKAAHEQLHKDDLFWTEPKADNNINTTTEADAPSSDLWTNQEPAPLSRIFWGKNSSRPSIGQVWLAAYGLVTLYPKTDAFAIQLQGPQSADVANELCRVGLLAKSPSSSSSPSSSAPDYFLFRGSFWQGAGSPFGSRPVWLPPASSAQNGEWEFPPLPLQHAFQTDVVIHRDHAAAADTIDAALSTPIRAPAPAPGTVVYSRWIPHLRAQLALSVLDAEDPKQVALYAAWHRHGTADRHAEYLRGLQHGGAGAGAAGAAIPLLATLDGRPAAYFEPYWVRDRVEDEIGAHFDAGAYDRGCGVLFPSSDLDPRVVAALWGSAVHYLFLDEPRTMRVFGAPAYVDGMAVGFEGRFPFSVARRVESVLAEETLAVCGRELFFQLCPFAGSGAVRVVERERGDGGLWAKL